jgi:3-oxoacyl-[acyl-carrier protein] reductase
VLDLRDPGAPAALVENVKEFGGLDILVTTPAPPGAATLRADRRRLGGAVAGSSRPCAARPPPGCAGTPRPAIAIGGTSGRKPEKSFTIGSSVNAAVAAFTKCLAHLGKEDGVQVNCIHPSLVETERQWRRIRAEVERSGEPEAKVREALCRETGIMRFGRVEDVADLVTFIVSKRATWMHGATVDLDGGEIPVL